MAKNPKIMMKKMMIRKTQIKEKVFQNVKMSLESLMKKNEKNSQFKKTFKKF